MTCAAVSRQTSPGTNAGANEPAAGCASSREATTIAANKTDKRVDEAVNREDADLFFMILLTLGNNRFPRARS